MRKIIIVVIGIIGMYSCDKQNAKVKIALELAEDNRKELEAVIDHYKESKEDLKLKATYFLISNMTHQYSVVGKKF